MSRRAKALVTSLAVYVAAVAFLAYGPVPAGEASAGSNGLWLGHRWFAGEPTEEELARLASRCHRSGIRDFFVHAGPIAADGTIPQSDPHAWRRVHRRLAAALPEARFFAWLGALNADFLGEASDTLSLADLDARAHLKEALEGLDRLGFDGVHYDVEPVRSGDLHFLELLEASAGRLISVATPQLRPRLVPGFPPADRLWTEDYYRQVSQRCDQVVLMGYDTLAPTSGLYRRYLTRQVRRLAKAVDCELLIGVPTYDDNAPYHNPRAETLQAALEAAAEGALGGRPGGVAVYAEWTTTPDEWDALSASFQDSLR